ncbi:NUDIX hydrolase [Propionicicella superfundia]|uniref:NUDIX hydrolase n=1 Tax=Propionicicella superfundia TaxID=348582 RepID=UPI000411EAE1|nr:CoA pyrophosphatase [Propionicicella superfundia]
MPLPESLRTLADSLTAGAGSLPGRPPQAGRDAGVLALVGEAETDPFLVFIEKLPTLRFHPGQIAFPGGRMEATDPDVIATAVREAEEETGVDPAGVDVFGTLPPAYLFASDWDVTTAVAWWRSPGALHPADATEIAAVHTVRVADLADPDNRSSFRHPAGFRGPAFTIGDLYIWGFTGGLVSRLLDLAGWSRSWDVNRETPIPDRFLAPGRG